LNAAHEDDIHNPTNRGYILHPEKNRRKGIYFIPAMSEEEQRHFNSQIGWSNNGDRIALVEAYQGFSYLLVGH
jgi:hypothetical protein